MPARFFTPEQEPEVVAQYGLGRSAMDIALSLGCSESTVFGVLRRNDVTIRSAAKALKPLTDEQIKEMRRLYESGKSPTAISKVFSLAHITVVRRLRALGYDVPSYDPHARGAAHPKWKGGRRDHGGTYISTTIHPDDPLFAMATKRGRVLEHRLVMARHLGRVLSQSEQVHHIDGNAKNNAIGNLQLRTGNHGTGIVLQCQDCLSHNVMAVPIADPEETT